MSRHGGFTSNFIVNPCVFVCLVLHRSCHDVCYTKYRLSVLFHFTDIDILQRYVRCLFGPRLAQARLQVDEAERHVGGEPALAAQEVGCWVVGVLRIFRGFRVEAP